MKYAASTVSKQTRILFPILVTLIAGLIVPRSVALVGFLMFGNLLRECGVLDSLSKTAQDVLANLITIFLGITIASQMQAESFLNPQTLLILALGLFAFIFDTFGRRRLCEDPQYLPAPEQEDQPDDRRLRHLRLPDEQPCYQ